MYSFLVLAFLSIGFLFLSGFRDWKKLSLFIIWQILVSVVAYQGLFMKTPILFIPVLLISILLSYGVILRGKQSKINFRWLLAIHLIRIPVEIGLYQLYLDKQLPQVMTFTGWNFDIVIGISAFVILLLSYFTNLHAKFLLIWNVVSSAFLLFIVCLAVLSSPLPIQLLGSDQPNIAVLQFPHYLLPTCIVPVVFTAHLAMIMSLKTK